ncbi:hypothetical protein QF044_000416 [Chryseobacterium sp. W4I1]|nr:hypothetical protein [Chryseobacterium sp. W4I1]
MSFRFFITLITLLLCINCISQQKNIPHQSTQDSLQKKDKIEKVEVTEQTRGTNRKMTFTPGSKIVSVNGNVSNSIVSDEDWASIIHQTDLIDLDKIASLKAPSEGRFTDRALSSVVSITVNGKVYQSSTFDSGIPPKELENLYQLLVKETDIK